MPNRPIKPIKPMKEINLAEILKDCPKGTKLYSPVFGEVKFMDIVETDDGCPIVIAASTGRYRLYSDGRCYLFGGKTAEIILFPSKDNRDWSTFIPPKKHKHFEPFQQPYRDKDIIPYEGNEDKLGKEVEL